MNEKYERIYNGLKEDYPRMPDDEIYEIIYKYKKYEQERATRISKGIMCKNCIFFDYGGVDYVAEDMGECRRFPPKMPSPPKYTEIENDIYLLAEDIEDQVYFPIVFETDWCGEFKPKKGIKTKVEQTSKRGEKHEKN